MTWLHTDRSRKDYRAAPPEVQKAFDKQVRLLARDLQHPSLRAKKYDKAAEVWQARVNRDWRFYFTIRGNAYIILAIIPHPK
jgi:plasmid maintenance system killer protein